jgi:hypothetical protein
MSGTFYQFFQEKQSCGDIILRKQGGCAVSAGNGDGTTEDDQIFCTE